MKRILLTLLTLMTLGLGASVAQTIVTGRILDERGQGLPGAGISVKGSPSIGTVTDLDGNFRLSTPSDATLVIQAVGYATQEVAAGAAGSVRMQVAAKELSGAVVTALAIRREKRELGYSSTTINSEDLNAGNNVSALSAIQGKTAGVNITSSTGGPGGSTRIVLRGEKSIGNNNNALIVIDGVPINNANRTAGRDTRSQIDFGNRGNDINPEDIESVTVLKGPAAAALYGSAGANGAVMYTTKSGRGKAASGKTNVTYSTSYYLSDPLKLPDFQDKYGQGDIHANESDRRENFSWGLPYDDKLRPWGQEINGQQKVKPYSALPDNVRDFFVRGRTWENNVALGSGSDKGAYYLSLNTLNNTGIIPNTFYNKYSVRLNANYNISDKLYSNVNLNYLNIYSRVEQSGQGNESVLNNIYQQPRDIPINELRDLSDPFNSMGAIDSNGVAHYGYYGAYTDNPFFTVENIDNRIRTDRVLGNATIGYKPSKNWDIFNRLGVDFVSDRITNKIGKFDLLPYDPFYFAGAAAQKRTNNGGFFQASSTSINFNNDLIANYNKQLSADIGFNGLVGANLQYNRTTLLSGNIDNQTSGLIIPGFYNLNNATGAPDLVDQYSDIRQYGLYTSLRADYRRQVYLEITARNDWTSTLTIGNNSFFYPSATASWVFTETFKDALSSQNIISFGKLRGGYSSVGSGAQTAYVNNNSAFVPNTAISTGFGTVKFPFNGTPGFTYQNAIGNPGLRPERTNASEIGIELALLRNRVSFEATYYDNLTTDQIVNVPTPPSTGFTSRIINLGDVRNKGIELAGRVTPISTKSGFKWELFGTYTKNKNEVERLPGGVTQISLGGIVGLTATATVGKPYGAFYGTDLATDSLGRVIIDSATGSPQLATNTVYKGTYNPRFTASWGTNLRFKGFQFNMLFQMKKGGVFFSRTKDILDFVGTSAETEKRDPYVFPNSVYQAGDGRYVTNTSITFDPYDYYTNIIPSGQHMVDASYVKLQEASLSYTLPDRWLKRTMFGGAQIGVFGNNLFIWTAEDNKYSDPEMNSGGASNLQGFDFTSRPSVRNYGMNLRVTF